ncbi:hypothetical protein HJD18_13605 [Thermoleophilia bacterium SCSIO 60948]|nr:hypothetical protein HJD18_13605 [Thermoleophilia bacterium SCSIO 60948]
MIAATGAALLTAYFAQRRQREQLQESADRHQAQLDAEAVRLDRQLDHARRMDDRSELRGTLDEVSAYLAALALSLQRATETVKAVNGPSVSAETYNRVEERVAAANAAVREAAESSRILTLRFPVHHPPVLAYRLALGAGVAHLSALEDVEVPIETETVDDLARRMVATEDRIDGFAVAVRAELEELGRVL